ncbi:MAG TPA: FAD-dependent monooxygenase [Acidobacteriaceae bacterium]|jgi:2-polyprenyl-6-methoxyphenol hydroxylase-like FAD-dependent oxidoreductase
MELRAKNSGNDTDVLIVGAGPVGLFVANECARRGLRWRLIEEKASQSEHSKALAIFPRTLEIFDMAGVVGPFLERANRVTTVAMTSHDRNLTELRFEPEETPYPFVAMVPQDVTESLMVKALAEKGGTVEYETVFVSAEESGDGVTAQLNRRGEAETLAASFVVGCDGARSKVRQGLGVPLEGGDYRDEFMLADMETNEFRPASEMLLCPSEYGPVALFPMSATRWRLVATIAQPEGEAPDIELVQKILRERAPAGIEVRTLHWSSYFRIHHRHAARLRVGKMFIAGDAAHIHSPFGGQGMNTGLHDAWNLVWKLDFYLRGHGNEQILDSYAAERLPVIRGVIETTDLMTKAMGTTNKVAQLMRDAVIPPVSHLAAFQHAFVQRLSGLGVAYHGSPIVDGGGKRYFDDSLRGGNGIRSRFLLLLGIDTDAATSEAAQKFCDGEVVEVRKSQGHGIRLVRPDGYVACTARRTDGVRAWEAMGALLAKQTR